MNRQQFYFVQNHCMNWCAQLQCKAPDLLSKWCELEGIEHIAGQSAPLVFYAGFTRQHVTLSNRHYWMLSSNHTTHYLPTIVISIISIINAFIKVCRTVKVVIGRTAECFVCNVRRVVVDIEYHDEQKPLAGPSSLESRAPRSSGWKGFKQKRLLPCLTL
eukprot:4573742-Amphidinium_carterae.2